MFFFREHIKLRLHTPWSHLSCRDFGTIALEPNRPSISFLGTLDYWSPECFTGCKHYSQYNIQMAAANKSAAIAYLPHALDCYSLGCTIYMMMA